MEWNVISLLCVGESDDLKRESKKEKPSLGRKEEGFREICERLF